MWVGGHVVLVRVILPAAFKEGSPARILDFERGYGRVGLAALAIQFTSGVWLAGVGLGGWENIFNASTPAARLVLVKLVLLTATVMQAGYAYHTVLPRLSSGGMRSFAIHAWSTTVLAVLMLIAGAAIRLGGLW